MGVAGIVALLGIAFALSTDRRRAVNGRILGWGLGLQFAMALFALRTRAGIRLFSLANDLADAFVGFADAGIRFVFGDWPATAVVHTPLGGGAAGLRPVTVGFVLAIKVLPIIVFVASLMAVGYHLGIMQRIVALLARGLSRTMHVSGAEALSTVGDIFLGMTEAPLLVRPYVARMTESELFAVMCAGMATISGSVLLAYVAMGVDAGSLITASFMSAPAAVMFAKIMIPETGTPETSDAARVSVPRLDVNIVDAAARGAGEGLQLALNVGGMLIAFVAIVSMCDKGVGWLGGLVGHPGWSLGRLLGAPLTPLAWLMGVPWHEAPFVGELLGTKTVLNEFIAYQTMTSHLSLLSMRSVRIASFALCGFANFGSLAIVLGGLGGMVPERRPDLARLGIRSIIAGSLATFLTGTIAGLVAP
ncbi:MAG TPA: nucleoside transporter C-terminal domain-containing protein [Polyangia bacterium]|nr:nucleoside transporter C-terminal domain-containing protein [Polyangia bacterium]